MNGRVLTKGLVIHLIVAIYSILYCVIEIKRGNTFKLISAITSELGILHTRIHIDLIILILVVIAFRQICNLEY